MRNNRKLSIEMRALMFVDKKVMYLNQLVEHLVVAIPRAFKDSKRDATIEYEEVWDFAEKRRKKSD